MLVEDDEAIRQLIVEILADAGYEVIAATNGRDGLRRVAVWRPDLILLDKLMPESDGTMFAREYRATDGPHAPIVAMCAARDGREWSDEIGAASFVIKPFDIDMLLDAVRAQLDREADRV